MSGNSISRHRVEIDRAVFGHPVVGSLTGRTMSTPDWGKPELVEVAVMRTDNEEGIVWVPVEATARLTYEVSVECTFEDHASPTDAVLSMIAWLRTPQAGAINFTVHCPDDKVTYAVEATQTDEDDVDAWVAVVIDAEAPGKGTGTIKADRPDLVPTKENA